MSKKEQLLIWLPLFAVVVMVGFLVIDRQLKKTAREGEAKEAGFELDVTWQLLYLCTNEWEYETLFCGAWSRNIFQEHGEDFRYCYDNQERLDQRRIGGYRDCIKGVARTLQPPVN